MNAMKKTGERAASFRGIFRLVLCAAALGGSSIPVFAASPAVVRLWNWNVHDKKYQQKMYRLFNERHPDIKIEFSSISNTVYGQTLEAAFIAKEPPDLFYPSEKLTFDYLRTKGMIMPLNDVAPDEKELKAWMAQYPPALAIFVEGVSLFNGKPYAVVLGGTTAGIYPLFYNKKLLSQAGVAKPPATQSELRSVAAKITQAGAGKFFGMTHGLRYGGVWGNDIEFSLAWALGVRGVDGPLGGPDLKTGTYRHGSPEFLAAMNVWIHMRKDGSVYPGGETMDDEQSKMAFATDKAAMQFGAPWNVGNYFAYNPDVDFGVVLPPNADDGVQRGFDWVYWVGGGTFGYVVPTGTKNPRAVWEVIKFVSSLEAQEGYVQGGYGVSYLPEANRIENYANAPQSYQFVEWTYTMRRRAPILSAEMRKLLSYFPGLYPTHTDVETNVYLGASSPDALKDLEKRANEGLDVAIKKAQEDGMKLTRKDFFFPDWDPSKDYVQNLAK